MSEENICGVFCEVCSYQHDYLELFLYVDDLVEHAKKHHWRRKGRAKNGQPMYLCSHCDGSFQVSGRVVVDFGGNPFCSISCMSLSLRERQRTHETTTLIKQQDRDEEYVLESLRKTQGEN